MDLTTLLLGLSLIAGFYMAWSIGANDVANAMGTSVGSGALSLKQAVMLAAVLEFAGAFFVGSHVTDTVRRGIIDTSVFDDPNTRIYGMLASLLAAAVWLQLASYFGWPVSTTHSIIGALLGFGAVVGGVAAVEWGVVVSIVLSWVVTPLLAAALAYLIFTLILRLIFYAPNPVLAARRATPMLVFAVLFVMTLVTVFKGLKPLGLHTIELHYALLIATAVGGVLALATSAFIKRRSGADEPASTVYSTAQYRQRALYKAAKHLRRVQLASDHRAAQDVGELVHRVRDLQRDARAEADTSDNPQLHGVYQRVERVFIFLQVLSAAFIAFAHGSNDVANAIGPVAAVMATLEQGEAALQSSVPTWVLALGGAGIVFGLATWGWRVIQTIGQRITELTPSRGFAAEFAAATTIVIASKASMPVSTTQTLVGAVLGVGFARGISALNLNTVRDIVASWIVTLPAGAGLSILLFYALRLIFG